MYKLEVGTQKQPMDDTDGKTGINIDEDDQVASSNSDYDYEGIFS